MARDTPTSIVQMSEESIVDVESGRPNSMSQQNSRSEQNLRPSLLVITLRPPPRSNSGNVDKRKSVGNIIKSSIGARAFSVTNLPVATNFFSQENLIGEGKVGRVYKGEFPNGKGKVG